MKGKFIAAKSWLQWNGIEWTCASALVLMLRFTLQASKFPQVIFHSLSIEIFILHIFFFALFFFLNYSCAENKKERESLFFEWNVKLYTQKNAKNQKHEKQNQRESRDNIIKRNFHIKKNFSCNAKTFIRIISACRAMGVRWLCLTVFFIFILNHSPFWHPKMVWCHWCRPNYGERMISVDDYSQ